MKTSGACRNHIRISGQFLESVHSSKIQSAQGLRAPPDLFQSTSRLFPLLLFSVPFILRSISHFSTSGAKLSIVQLMPSVLASVRGYEFFYGTLNSDVRHRFSDNLDNRLPLAAQLQHLVKTFASSLFIPRFF